MLTSQREDKEIWFRPSAYAVGGASACKEWSGMRKMHPTERGHPQYRTTYTDFKGSFIEVPCQQMHSPWLVGFYKKSGFIH